MAKSTKRVRILRNCALITQAAAFCVVSACASTGTDGASDTQGQATGTAMTPTQMAAPSMAGAGATPTMSVAAAGRPASSAAAGSGSTTTATTGAAGAAMSAAAAGSSASGTAGAGMSAAAGSGMSGAAGGGAASGGPATWTMVYDALFATSAMAGCGACHGGAPNMSLNGGFGGLMTKEAAFAALVGKSSSTAMCMGKTYVKAGSPDESLLYQKVAAAPMCGMRMPPGGMLAADKVELIKAWIMAGAMDN